MLSTISRRALRARAPLVNAIPGTRSASGHGGHGPRFNEPSGWLFGQKPLAPGQKRQREGWELLWYWGMYGGMALAAVLLYYQPDTSIQTWAMKEARRRMIERGEEVEYKPSSSS